MAISRNEGRTWQHDWIIRDDGPDGDLGYPSTVELADGRAVTDAQAELIGLKTSHGHFYGNDCSDGVLLTNRAGSTQYERTFMEALGWGADGVTILFNRGYPLVRYEAPVQKRFRELYARMCGRSRSPMNASSECGPSSSRNGCASCGGCWTPRGQVRWLPVAS